MMALHISASSGVMERMMNEVLLGRKGECSVEKVTKEWADYESPARARY